MKAKTTTTPAPPTPKKNGRPRESVNWDLFEDLCKIHCSRTEILNVLGINKDTLLKNISEHYGVGETFITVYRRFTDFGKQSLRRAMFSKAIHGKNTSMQIFLSKNILGMSEKNSVAVTVPRPIVIDAADGKPLLTLTTEMTDTEKATDGE